MVPDDYDSNNPPPIGAMLKVEENTNISLHTISSSLWMSRLTSLSETLDKTAVPGSACVFWPRFPSCSLRQSDGLCRPHRSRPDLCRILRLAQAIYNPTERRKSAFARSPVQVKC